MQRITIVLICLLLGSSLVADTIILKNGVRVDAVVMKSTEDKVIYRIGHSTFAYPKSFVDSIEKDKSSNPKSEDRLPSCERCLDVFASQKWVTDIRDIPSTVVDVGILKNVPYSSYKFGDYEMNVYGDPAHPAGIEIGVYKKLAETDEAKKNCLSFMTSLLPLGDDRKALESLKLAADKKVLAGLTFEITPPTAEDSYGGWWISIYDEHALNKARASDEEMKSITIKKADVRKVAVTPDPVVKSKPAEPVVPLPIVQEVPTWRNDDLQYARQSSQGNASSGGTVYVRGYTRKDGTYVRPHTRRK